MTISPEAYAAIGAVLFVLALVIPSPLAELATFLGIGMVGMWMLGP